MSVPRLAAWGWPHAFRLIEWGSNQAKFLSSLDADARRRARQSGNGRRKNDSTPCLKDHGSYTQLCICCAGTNGLPGPE